ncbi:MAG: type II toxin-antitoxin system VapC family toxin [Anaerolineales bacterium]
MSDSPTFFVLDSFALLAYLGGETGEGRTKEILHEAVLKENHAFMSLINLGEVVYISERERGLAKAQEVLAVVEQLPFEILPVNRQTVLAAAHIKASYPIAYADAFAVVAAQEQNGTLVTGDPEFESVKDIVQIEWVG